jgi:hypothetical protein
VISFISPGYSAAAKVCRRVNSAVRCAVPEKDIFPVLKTNEVFPDPMDEKIRRIRIFFQKRRMILRRKSWIYSTVIL